MGKMNLDVNEVNKKAITDKKQFIENCENCYHERIEEVAKYVYNNPSCKIILLSGPSSSGKTTTSHILIDKLEQIGIHSITVSTDDFFVNRWQTPKAEDGSYDYECTEATNLPLLKKCLKELLEKKEAYFPKYNFVTGESILRCNRIELKQNTVIIVEGIHALNPILTEAEFLKDSLKVYVCVFTNFTKDGEIILSARNLRLTRRILRDSLTRNTTPEQSIAMWKNVLRGEELYIKPFVGNANFVIDTTHGYEPLVYKNLILPKLINLSNEVSKELLNDYLNFESLPSNLIPTNSLLNEFVIK